MLQESPLRLFLQKQQESTFIIAKYTLALFNLLLAVVTLVVYNSTEHSCSGYNLCFNFLTVSHFFECICHLHDSRQGQTGGVLQDIYKESYRQRRLEAIEVEEESISSKILQNINYLGAAFAILV